MIYTPTRLREGEHSIETNEALRHVQRRKDDKPIYNAYGPTILELCGSTSDPCGEVIGTCRELFDEYPGR